MFDNINFGRYIYKDSIIDKIHPLSKIIIALITILLIISNNILENLFLFLIFILIIFISKINYKLFINSILKLKLFLISIIIINLIFNIEILLIVNNIFKIILIIIDTSILMYTTSTNNLIYGISMLLKPLKKIKLNPNKIALSISFSLKFIPIILEQSSNTFESLISRGIDYKSSKLKEKIKILQLIILPIFINSIRKADNISDIMELRLYDINKTRSNYRINKWNFIDTLYLILFFMIFIILIIMR